MLRNVNFPIPEFSQSRFRTSQESDLKDNGWNSEQTPRIFTSNALEIRTLASSAEKHVLNKSCSPLLRDVVGGEEMPRLDSGLILNKEHVPVSPETPTLFPFVFENNGISTGESCDSPPLVNGSPTNASTFTAKAFLPAEPRQSKQKPVGECKTKQLSCQDKRLQPVVMLQRLMDYDPSDNKQDLEENSAGSWIQWPEEYEGCSYDDYLDPGQVVEKLPEVDVIDGVEFLSFLQEVDVKDYAQKTPLTMVFPSEGSSLNGFDTNSDEIHINKDEHNVIVPTKTRDITQIKGWKRKLFLDDNYTSTHPDCVSPADQFESTDDQFESTDGQFESTDRAETPVNNELSLGLNDNEVKQFPVGNSPVNTTPLTGLIHSPVVENPLVLGEQPQSKETAKNAAFASSNLDIFLEKHSQLGVSYLSQCNPTVSFIPHNHPVLAVGSLKVEEKEPRRKRARTVAEEYLGHKPQIKTELAVRKRLHSPRYNPGLKKSITSSNRLELGYSQSAISTSEKKEENKVIKSEIDNRTEVFIDDSSNSLIDIESFDPMDDYERLSNRSMDFGNAMDLDNSLQYENKFPLRDEIGSFLDDYMIEEYQPVTYDEETLLASIKEPLRIIKETVWSTKDTSQEERLLYNLLCNLKSPDSYLISKIKFDEDSISDANESLTEDDAQEVSKCLYGGCDNIQEFVEKEKEKAVLERKLQRKARKRNRKREQKSNEMKHDEQKMGMHTVSGCHTSTDFIVPLDDKNDSKLLHHTKRKPAMKRSIRKPARFMDSPISEHAVEDWITIKSSQDNDSKASGYSRTVSPTNTSTSPLPSRQSTPVLHVSMPNSSESSSAFSGFDSGGSGSSSHNVLFRSTPSPSSKHSSGVPNNMSPFKQSETWNELSKQKTDLKLDRAETKNPVEAGAVGSKDLTWTKRKNRRKRSRAAVDSEIEIVSTIGNYKNDSNGVMGDSKSYASKDTTHLETKISRRDGEQGKLVNNFEGILKRVDTNVDAVLHAVVGQSPEDTSSEKTNSEPWLASRESLSDPMVLNISAPISDRGTSTKTVGKPATATNGSTNNSKVSIKLGSGVHTITPKNFKKIQQIKMNLNSTVSLDQKAQMAIQRQPPVDSVASKYLSPTIHLIPLNEYQWKPPNDEMSTSPTIKSFIINSSKQDRAVLPKDGAVSMPLAAVARPVGIPASEEIYLLYGTIGMLPTMQLPSVPGPELNSRKASSGLVIGIGQQEFFMSCSVELAKAPVRLNAIIAKTIMPLLLYPVLKSDTKSKSLQEGIKHSSSDTLKISNSRSSEGSPTKNESKICSTTRAISPERTTTSCNQIAANDQFSKGIPLLPAAFKDLDNKSHHFRISWKDQALSVDELKPQKEQYPALAAKGDGGRAIRPKIPLSFPKSLPPIRPANTVPNQAPSSVLKPLACFKAPASGVPPPVQFRLAMPTKLKPGAVIQENSVVGRNLVKESNSIKKLTLAEALSTIISDRSKTVLEKGFGDHCQLLASKVASSSRLQTKSSHLLQEGVKICSDLSSPMHQKAQVLVPVTSKEALSLLGIVSDDAKVIQKTVCKSSLASSDLRVANNEPPEDLRDNGCEIELSITDVRSCVTNPFSDDIQISSTVSSSKPTGHGAPSKTQTLSDPLIHRLPTRLQSPPVSKPPVLVTLKSPPVSSAPPKVGQRELNETVSKSRREPYVIDLETDDVGNSVWISGEGETCFVMRLPDEADEDDDVSEGPTVVTCS